MTNPGADREGLQLSNFSKPATGRRRLGVTQVSEVGKDWNKNAMRLICSL